MMVAASIWLFAGLGLVVVAAAGGAAYTGARRSRREPAWRSAALISAVEVEFLGESQYSLTLQNVGSATARDVCAFIADQRLPSARLSNEALFGALAPGERRSRVLGIREQAAAARSVMQVATSWSEGRLRPRRYEPRFSPIRLPPLSDADPLDNVLGVQTAPVRLPPPVEDAPSEEPLPISRAEPPPPVPEEAAGAAPEAMPESVPEVVAEVVPDVVTEVVPEAVSEAVPEAAPEAVPDVVTVVVPRVPEAEAAVDASSNGAAPVVPPEPGAFVFDRVRRRSFRGDRHSSILERLDVDEPGDRFVLGSVGSDGSVDLYEWLLDRPLSEEERREVDRTIRA